MFKQLGMPTYLLTLSCTDLRWEELPHINKLNSLGRSDEELKNLSHQKRCILLNNNPGGIFSVKLKYVLHDPELFELVKA